MLLFSRCLRSDESARVPEQASISTFHGASYPRDSFFPHFIGILTSHSVPWFWKGDLRNSGRAAWT